MNGSTRQSMMMAARALVTSPIVRRSSMSASSRRGSIQKLTKSVHYSNNPKHMKSFNAAEPIAERK